MAQTKIAELIQTLNEMGSSGAGVFVFGREVLHLGGCSAGMEGQARATCLDWKTYDQLCPQCQNGSTMILQRPYERFKINTTDVLGLLGDMQVLIKTWPMVHLQDKLQAYLYISKLQQLKMPALDMRAYQNVTIDVENRGELVCGGYPRANSVIAMLGLWESVRQSNAQARRLVAEKAKDLDDRTLSIRLLEDLAKEASWGAGKPQRADEEALKDQRRYLSLTAVLDRESVKALEVLYRKGDYMVDIPRGVLETMRANNADDYVEIEDEQLVETALRLHQDGGEYDTLAKAFEAARAL